MFIPPPQSVSKSSRISRISYFFNTPLSENLSVTSAKSSDKSKTLSDILKDKGSLDLQNSKNHSKQADFNSQFPIILIARKVLGANLLIILNKSNPPDSIFIPLNTIPFNLLQDLINSSNPKELFLLLLFSLSSQINVET